MNCASTAASPSVTESTDNDSGLLRSDLEDLQKAILLDMRVLFKEQQAAIKQMLSESIHSSSNGGHILDAPFPPNVPEVWMPQAAPAVNIPIRKYLDERSDSKPSANKSCMVIKTDLAADVPKENQKRRGMLSAGGDAEELSDEPVYDVTSFYHTKGYCQLIGRSELFSNITLAIIAINAIYLGIDTNFNEADTLLEAHWGFQVCEHAFCIFFTFEWLVRFGAFKHKVNCLRDDWFKFDSCLVFLMVGETWVMTIVLLASGSGGISLPTGPLRLLRLLRLTRLTRLMRSMPELLTLVNGMKAASRAVGSSLLLVALLIYIFAIVLHMFLGKEESVKDQFATLPLCMWTLLMDGTLTDSTKDTLAALFEIGAWPMVLIFLAFVLLSAMTVMNMLIGVLCEVVSAVKAGEEESAAMEVLKSTVLVCLKELDEDGSGDIDKNEMESVLNRKEALGCLQELSVDVIHLLEVLDMAYEEKDSLSMVRLMQILLDSRGEQPVDKKALYDEMIFVRWHLDGQFTKLASKMEDFVEQAVARVAGKTIAWK